MSTTTKSVTEIADEAELERMRAELKVAEAKAAAARRAAEERRQAAYEEFDRQTVAEFDESDWNRQIADAEEALADAVAAHPVYAAVRELYRLQTIRTAALSEAVGAAVRLGLPEETFDRPRGGGPINHQELWDRLWSAGQAEAMEVIDAAGQARLDAGELAARTIPTSRRTTRRPT